MSSQELSEFDTLLDTLKRISNESEFSPDILGRTFDTCMKLSDLLEDSNLSEESRQDTVELCISSLEKCTHMVNDLDLFSSNETFDEIQTSSIKYLLLPALLGKLNLALQSLEISERYGFLEIAEVYFKDYLLRCRNYELSKRPLINKHENEVLEDIYSEEYILKPKTLADAAAIRETKIQRFKLIKQLKDRENELKPALERQDAEEYIREYYHLILERCMLTATEELTNIAAERSIIRYIDKKQNEPQQTIPKEREIKPLKPIIITKNEVQKKVFGLGYPSLPIMTIDDFYRQRFEKMVNEHKSSGKSLQEMASAGGGNNEEEEIEKENLLEKDNLEALQKARSFDDWKDDNPRGSGNRKNKG